MTIWHSDLIDLSAPRDRNAPKALRQIGSRLPHTVRQAGREARPGFNILFFALLLDLGAAGVGFQLVTGLQTPAQ